MHPTNNYILKRILLLKVYYLFLCKKHVLYFDAVYHSVVLNTALLENP
jgi:hypothetical protein